VCRVFSTAPPLRRESSWGRASGGARVSRFPSDVGNPFAHTCGLASPRVHTRAKRKQFLLNFTFYEFVETYFFFPRPRDQKRKKQHKNTREHLRCSPTPRRDRKKPTSRISLSIRCWRRRPKNDILPVARFKMKSAAVSTKASNSALMSRLKI